MRVMTLRHLEIEEEARVGLIHDGPLRAEPLEGEFGVAVHEALDVGVDGLDLLALLYQALFAVWRRHCEPILLRVAPVWTDRRQRPSEGQL